MPSFLQREPAAIAGFMPAFVGGLMQLLTEFHVPISAGQATAIVSLLTIALGFWVRSKVSPVQPPRDPPSASKPPSAPTPLIPAAALCLVLSLLSCSGDKPPPVHVPTPAEVEKLCPGLFEAATLKCAEIAVKYCNGYESLAECPNGEKAHDECEALRAKEAEKCH